MDNTMPSKPPLTYPTEQRVLTAFGERLRLARRRRKLTTITVAERAGIARTTLYKAEAGDPGVTLGTYVRILATLGMEKDFAHLAADDKVGRTLQDLALTPTPKRRKSSPTASQP
jgi:transcriptional regulator with XRE-family HTH domain